MDEMNILVVDDDASHRLLMRDQLAAKGWHIFLAEDGREALEKMGRTKMDFIISDVYMPGMDGVRFHKAVRETPGYETVPFVFVSAYNDQHALGAVKNPAIEAFFSKGRPIDELTDWVMYLTTKDSKHRP